MLKNMKLVLMIVLSIFLVACNAAEEEINVSELIEKGEVEIAGNSFDLFYESLISYKYDGENLVEQTDKNQKILFYYDDNELYKHEIFSASSDKLYATINYSYDSDGKEIRKDTVVDQTQAKLYQTTSYDKNYKEISYYDKDGELSSVGEIELNDKEQMIKYNSKSNDGSLESVSYYKYENDNLILRQSTDDKGVIREVYYDYNESGDQIAVIAITYRGRKNLSATYYDNEYEDLKLVSQTAYTAQGELNEQQINDIVKSLK